MWPRHDLTELLDIRQPILQAPMAGAASPALAAAVSAAGGLGGYGAAADSPERLREVIREIRQRTEAPFNINLFTPGAQPSSWTPEDEESLREVLESMHVGLDAGPVPEPVSPFGGFDQQISVLLEERVPVVSFHFGLPDPEVVRTLQENGARVLCTATSPEEAELLDDGGADAIIAQGHEAGGHQGTFDPRGETADSSRLGTLSLVPEVVDRVDGTCPVIAAGGIMDRRGIEAAFALGASGVQMGTAFLACSENTINRAYRRRLLESQGSDTVITTAISGRPARGIANRLIHELEPHPRLPYPEHYSMTRRLRSAASQAEEPEYLAMWAGQGVGRLREWSAAELMESLCRGS